jgi:addiction module HigA family antidote
MPLKSPPHPGRIVNDALDDIGLPVADAAKGLGVTRQQLHNVVSGRSAISPEMAVRLEKAIGSTAETWLRMQAAYDLAQIATRDIPVQRLAAKTRAA